MKNNQFKLAATLLALAVVTGCTGRNHSFDWQKPVSLNMNPPQGPHNYQQGWSDGCESAVASTNKSLHQFLGSYKFKLDNELRYKALYNRAWRYGYNHCGYSLKALAQYGL